MKSKILFIILISTFGVISCGPSFSTDQAQVTSTINEYQGPVVVEEDGYDIVRGGFEVAKVQAHYDDQKKTVSLQGDATLLSVRSSQPKNFSFDLEGKVDEHGFAILKATGRGTSLPSDVKLAAKATCLGENGDCYSSFIDIYISYEDVVYHHQLESRQEKPVIETKPETEPAKPSTPAQPSQPTPANPSPAPTVNPVPQKPEQSENEDEDQDDEHEDDHAGEAGGRYVGDTAKDIEDLLEIQPKKKDQDTNQPTDKEIKPTTKKVSQAIDQVNKGRLENAIDGLKFMNQHAPAGFYILRPERKTYFGTNELLYMIAKMGAYTKAEVPGYILPIGDMAKEKGGAFGTHKSHQTGLDADIAFYFESKNLQRMFTSAVAVDKPHSSWMMDKQWGLFKMAVKTKLVDRIFIHKTLKKALCQLAIKNGEISKADKSGDTYETLRRLIADTDHNTHFHLRLKCSKAQVRCRQLPEPVNSTGCF